MDVSFENLSYIDQVTIKRLERQLETLTGKQAAAKKQAIENQLIQATAKIQTRLESLPKAIQYPDLPILLEKDKIIEQLKQHNVIIVAGETGSGKSTQLAKFCLEAGYGVKGMIGHTQPRRIAATSIAKRVSQELNKSLGELVGYKIRFKDQTSENTLIKVVTDGMMLSETQTDRLLLQYEVIIIDEAHERSLNIDILLGLLKKILQKRDNLKVIVTSATMQLEAFCDFFNAPLIEVPGRQYPVESIFKEPAVYDEESEDKDKQDTSEEIAQIVKQIIKRDQGDILIFQSGEREILETIEVLNQLKLRDTTILPLYARLSAAAQQSIFKTVVGRKIIVSTNVAETSITVPNIRFVIDAGYHKINRYNYKNKLHRLEIEPISFASHIQRKGRCGRVGPGVYYALFEEEDLQHRAEYTDPEILRTSLAKVILNLLDLNIKDIAHFPFISAPNYKYIKDGMRLLAQLGAINENEQLTKIGKQMARIPIEPRLSRMLLEAQTKHCLNEMLIIVSALSIQDPRESPLDKREQARQKHLEFVHEKSEFMSYLNLWDFLKKNKKELKHKAFVALCRKYFLSFVRVCEWFDLYDELKQIVKRFDFKLNQKPGDYESIHRAILPGLLDHIGIKDEKKEYTGARSLKFILHPSSHLKSPPQWAVCAELFHTTKTYAKTIAQIEPQWLVTAGKSLIKYTYLEPHYDKASQSVMAVEKASLFGLEVQRKKIFFEKKNIKRSNQIFLMEALVSQQMDEEFNFYIHNQTILNQLEYIAHKTRYRHIFFNEDQVYEHYHKRLPQTIASVRALKQWLKENDEESLRLSLDTFIDNDSKETLARDYPEQWHIDGISLNIQYKYEPGEVEDGATLLIPLEVLPFVANQDNSWPILGWMQDRLSEDLRTILRQYKFKLPTQKQLISELIEELKYRQGNYEDCLTQALASRYQVIVNKDYFTKQISSRPSYLNWHYCIIENDKTITKGDDIKVIFQQLKQKGLVKEVLTPKAEKAYYDSWAFGEIAEQTYRTVNQKEILVYPALVDEQNKLSINYFNTLEVALQTHVLGLIRLFELTLMKDVKYLKKQIADKGLIKTAALFDQTKDLKQQIIEASLFECFINNQTMIRDQITFESRLTKNKNALTKICNQFYRVALDVFKTRVEIERQCQHFKNASEYKEALNDIRQQLDALFTNNFLICAGLKWFSRYPVYLKAIQFRLDKLPQTKQQDLKQLKEIVYLKNCLSQYRAIHLAELSDRDILPVSELSKKITTINWKIEELRVSHFAQRLGTIVSVSRKRILKELE